MFQRNAKDRLRALSLVGAVLLTSACTPTTQDPRPDTPFFPALEAARIAPPKDAPKGSCWVKDVTPAVIETVTAQIIEQPAILNDDGSLLAPAIYATETRQEIVVPRKEHIFQTLCAKDITPDFIASLQRAFAARKRYTGPITGKINPATEDAIRIFQKEQGLQSSLLSIKTARALGLVAVERS